MMLVKIIIILSFFMIIGFSQPVFAETGTLTIIKNSNEDIPIIYNVTNLSTSEYSKLHLIAVENGKGMTCPMVLPTGEYGISEWFGPGVSVRDVKCYSPVDGLFDPSDVRISIDSGTDVFCYFDNFVDITTYDPSYLDPYIPWVVEPNCAYDNTAFINVIKNITDPPIDDVGFTFHYVDVTTSSITALVPVLVKAGETSNMTGLIQVNTGPITVKEVDWPYGWYQTMSVCDVVNVLDDRTIGSVVNENVALPYDLTPWEALVCTFTNKNNTLSNIPIDITGSVNTDRRVDADGNTIITGNDTTTNNELFEVTFPDGTTNSTSEPINIIYDDSGENAFVEVTGADVPYPDGKTIKINTNPGDAQICIIDSSARVSVSGLPDCGGATDLSESRVKMSCDGIKHTYEEEPVGHYFPQEPLIRNYTCTLDADTNFMTVTGLAYSLVYPIHSTPLPNLIVANMTHFPLDPDTKDLMKFTATVRNQGMGPSNSNTTLMFKIGGETPGLPNTLFIIPPLNPGESSTPIERTLTLSVAQNYTNTATADFRDVVLESNETDNTLTDEYTVVPGGCLIATAAYGSELSPQVQMLREIRDNSLMQTESGKLFMQGFNQFYYSFSPTVAGWEQENPAFRQVVKTTITPLITSLSLLNHVSMDSEIEVLGYGISLILLNLGMYFVAPAIVVWQVGKRI